MTFHELEHRYGPHVHLLDNAYLWTLLARLSAPEVSRAELLSGLRTLYTCLLIGALGAELPRVRASSPTRMAEKHGALGFWSGPRVDPATQIVVCDIIRGGIVPAQVCFELCSAVVPEANVRQDHMTLSRRSDQEGRVEGVDLLGSKIGGPVQGAVLLLPDPMGATGSTAVRVYEHYCEHHGRPAKVLALPMIVTPEFLKRALPAIPNLAVYAARLDRGLSSPAVLASLPGSRWNEERGLDDHQYIVPGAGGLGEILNNAWC